MTPRGDSQRKQAGHAKPAVQYCEFAQALLDGWTRVNQGGNRDCAFRALAAAMHYNVKRQKLGQEASRTEGGILRTQILDHLRRHQDDYAPAFAQDRAVAPEDPPPDTEADFKAWLGTLADPCLGGRACFKGHVSTTRRATGSLVSPPECLA